MLVILGLFVNFITSNAEFEVIESSNYRSLIKIKAMDSLEGNVISGMIGVPPGSNVKARILSTSSPCVSLTSLGIMRDYEVVRFSFSATEEEVLLELKYGGDFAIVKPSFAFEPLYKSMLINYNTDMLRDFETPLKQVQSRGQSGRRIGGRIGGYLIIVPDEFYDAVKPLAHWKRLKGWKTTVCSLSNVGNDTNQIKAYIRDAYNTWDPSPEYVVLVGDVDKLPTFYYPATATDHPYSLLDGNDYLSDILVGRISVTSVSELQVVVNKILGYEKNPYPGDWYKKALVVGGNYPAPVTTAIPTKRWVRELLLASGYTEVDTVFYPPTANGVVPITESINDGVSFVNFRGWANYWGWHYPRFYSEDVQALSNGWKLPVVMSISCATGNFNAPLCFGEAWLRAGTPSNPSGGVAFYGPSTANTHTRHNNCIDYGIFWSIFKEKLFSLGQATYRGKMELCVNFPADTSIKNYFYYYNILGDPELPMWTDVPESINVQHSPIVDIGTNFLEVTVKARSTPLEGALVSLVKEGEVEVYGFTDVSGFVSIPIGVTTPGTLFVTVTAHNYIPYSGYVSVGRSNVYVGLENYIIDDDMSGSSQGNGDGNINPGEIIEIGVRLKNYGTTDIAYGVQATLSSSDNFVTLIDSVRSFGDIPAGGSATTRPYVFKVAQACTNNHILGFQLKITSGVNSWSSCINIPVYAPNLMYVSHQVIDGGNGVLDPGETVDLEVRIFNLGRQGISNVKGLLRPDIKAVSVVDSEGVFGNILPGDSATNSVDRFRVYAEPSCAVGRSVGFTMSVTGSYSQVIHFSIIIGDVDSTSPLGPDAYGYYAYDNTDVDYDESPVYQWVEIDPEYGGYGTLIPLARDKTKVVTLPFVFRFYGKDYTRISVCSNGYISMDSIWLADQYNWHIPSSMGPPTVIAPFWDYLDPTARDSGNVVYYNDTVNHRFIVEWSRVYNVHEIPPSPPTPSQKQTFQVIFLDPAYYPTLTGDGEIIFQYHTVVNDDTGHNYCTVGIEDKTHTTGVEYTFCNIYPEAAAKLCNGRAIKFTTDPPDTFRGVEEYRLPVTDYQLFQNYPNPFTKKTEIRIQGTGGRNKKTDACLKIYDLTGRVIQTFTITQLSNNLITKVIWDGKNESGQRVAGGIYFYKLFAGEQVETKKMILLNGRENK